MRKIYNYLVDLGSAVAALLTFTPFISVYLYKYTNKWWIILIVSILYDIYWYDNIQNKEYIKRQVKQMESVEKQKGIFESKEAKLQSYKIICQNIINYFKK